MIFIDTHAHLYMEEFAPDRNEMIQSAIDKGVHYMLLPNVDSESWVAMFALSDAFPHNCLPMAGLHPTSVNADNVEQELRLVESWLEKRSFCAIGEIGMDLYWDKTFVAQQEMAFQHQVLLAKKYQLPVVIHMRKSFDELWKVLKPLLDPSLKGVFHCYSGDLNQARRITEAGFLLGIGGVLTYKNSGLQEIVKEIGIDYLVLETDAPFLPPVPHRGQRNDSSYIPLIAAKVAEITGFPLEEVAAVTTRNARQLFSLK